MSYRVSDWTALDSEVHRIADEQIDRALVTLGDDSLDETARVHAVRKRCKKLRALLRLVRPRLKKKAYRRANRHWRDTARRVSTARDAAAFIGCYDRVCAHAADGLDRRGTASIRAALTRRLRSRNAALSTDGHLERLAGDLARGRTLIDSIEIAGAKGRGDASDFAALREGFVAVHDRARRCGDLAARGGDAEAYHEWRRHAKYHRLHLQLLRSLWPVPLTALHAEACRLGELLGDAHDIVALDAHLRAEPDGLGDPRHVASFLVAAHDLRAELERVVHPLGKRLFAEKGARVAARLERWYEADRS